jgi:hypothetical protein
MFHLVINFFGRRKIQTVQLLLGNLFSSMEETCVSELLHFVHNPIGDSCILLDISMLSFVLLKISHIVQGVWNVLIRIFIHFCSGCDVHKV